MEIDGADFTAECDEFRFATKRLVYEEDDGQLRKGFCGPAGFQVTLINPSGRARALVDGGVAARSVKIIADGAGNSITHSTHFIEEWTTTDGTRKVFGRLAWDTDRDAKWVDEPQLAEA
ncbi:hypothetical protein RB200_19425 [Streptomyces sp. PmtG]